MDFSTKIDFLKKIKGPINLRAKKKRSENELLKQISKLSSISPIVFTPVLYFLI
jgi:hypothetical protein